MLTIYLSIILVVLDDLLTVANGLLPIVPVKVSPEGHQSIDNFCVELLALGAPQFLTGHGNELRRALEETNEVVENFSAQIAGSLGHHSDEAVFDMLLISLDLVDDFRGVLLLDL